MSAKKSKSEDDINFQTYVNEVTDGKIRWNIFVNLMKDLSYSDIDRLKKLNATLLTELTINFSTMDRLKYLNEILLRELKNFIQKVEERDINEHIDTIDHDLKEEKIVQKIQENSNENEIQTSIGMGEDDMIEENLESSNPEASSRKHNAKLLPQSTIDHDLNEEKIQEHSKENEIQTPIGMIEENLDSLNSEVSSINNVQIFQCSFCNKVCGMKFHLKQHIKKSHVKKSEFHSP